MRVMAIGDTPDRMTEDLDRGLGHVLVAIRGTGLAKVLEFPGLVFSSLDVQLELNTSEVAEFLKLNIGARSAAEENGLVRDRILRHEALDVSVNDTIHRPVEGSSRFHATIEEPPQGDCSLTSRSGDW